MKDNIFLGQTDPTDSSSYDANGNTDPTDTSSSNDTGENKGNTSPTTNEVFLPEDEEETQKPKNNILLYLGAGLLLYFFVFKRK
jgi:hypothetical protein